MSSLDKFLAKWQLETHTNFENYMIEVGVGWITRKGALASIALSPTFEITKNGKYKFITKSTFKNQTIEFNFGEEFDETTLDGRAMRTTIVQEGDKLVQRQTHVKDGDKDTILTYWIEDGKLHLTWKSGAVESHWIFVKT